MQRPRHITLIAIALAAVVAVGGCGSSSSSGSGSGGGKQGDVTIGFVPGIASDPFFKAMQIGAESKAKELGIKLVWQGAPDEYSPQTQLPFVEGMFTRNVDALALVPTDADALQASVTKAKARKIPVVTVDTTVTDQADLVSHITGDNVDGGRQAARTLAKQIGGRGKVLLMNGSPTATTNTQRKQGFVEGLKEFPEVKLVGEEFANSQPATATSKVNARLLKDPDIKGIFAADGTSGSGTVAALRNSKRAGTIKLVGYDAYANQIADLKAGIYSALIAQKPGDEAARALEYLVATVRDKGTDAIKKSVVLKNVVITKDNLGQTGRFEYPAK